MSAEAGQPELAPAQRLRVLVVTNMYPTAAEPGFAPFVQEQVEALAASPGIAEVDVQVIDGRASTLNYFKAIPELRRRVRLVSYDVVHAHYGLSGAVAIAQRRVPVVVTYHGSDVDNDAPRMRWQRWVSRFVARVADANVVVSERIARRLGRPAELIPCGIDMEAFIPGNRSAARAELGVPSGALALLFPSTPKRPEKEYGRFEAVVGHLRAAGTDVHPIVLEGFTRAQVPVVMAAADVMVMTSSVEGSPVAVMEALACGLPVVATDVGDVASMLSLTDRGTAAAFDVEQFAAEALRLAAGDARERHAGAERFDMDGIIARLDEVFRRLSRSDSP